jgi:hypothetical protein
MYAIKWTLIWDAYKKNSLNENNNVVRIAIKNIYSKTVKYYCSICIVVYNASNSIDIFSVL